MSATDAGKVTMLCTTIMWIKFFITLSIQGSKRFSGGSRPPEDSVYKQGDQNYGLSQGGVSDAAREEDMRWQRIVQNDVENLPLGLVVMWGTLGYADDADAHIALALIWTVMRILHTVFYAIKIPFPRSIVYILGQISVLGMLINGCVGAFE
mmetsp:Transcript_19750/g.22409  ORF Transcript_19750/g.22409 Transcript_19750/m.22409 type:complete len:152 (-) Transcript_19750:206-661(-)